jgi:Spy/CpxP family protein refolding chaperone
MTPDTKKIKSAQRKMHDIKFQILGKETEFKIAMREVLTKDQLSRFLALGGEKCQGPDRFGHHPPRPQQPERY